LVRLCRNERPNHQAEIFLSRLKNSASHPAGIRHLAFSCVPAKASLTSELPISAEFTEYEPFWTDWANWATRADRAVLNCRTDCETPDSSTESPFKRAWYAAAFLAAAAA